MKRNKLVNLGFPLFIDAEKDMHTKPKSTTDSWYIRFNFEHEGRQIGMEWHQMIIRAIPVMKLSFADFLVMDATNDIYHSHTACGMVSKDANATPGKCQCISKMGVFEGDATKMTLKLLADEDACNLTFRPTGDVHANGGTGLLPILGAMSYQYSFPNAVVSGTLTLGGETIQVHDAIAWFDRQYTNATGKNINPNWLWLGCCLDPDNKISISLWDGVNFAEGTTTGMATIRDENGVHSEHVVDFAYHESWESSKTGNCYPRDFTVSIPTADFAVEMHTIQSEPEFQKAYGPIHMNGCQALCTMKGHYKDIQIDRVEIVEMLGDLCGE